MPEFSDILIIFIWVASALLFYFLWTEKLYRFYFWLILGFLLFLVFNSQIKLAEMNWWIISSWESFLIWNKWWILSFFSFMIPIFWFLFSFLDSDLKSNKLFSILFWFFMPLFGLWLFWFILSHSSIELWFLKNILSIFNNSYIFNLLENAPKILFILLILIIFWKYIFRIIITFLAYLAKLILSEIKDLNWENKQEKKIEHKKEM